MRGIRRVYLLPWYAALQTFMREAATAGDVMLLWIGYPFTGRG